MLQTGAVQAFFLNQSTKKNKSHLLLSVLVQVFISVFENFPLQDVGSTKVLTLYRR